MGTRDQKRGAFLGLVGGDALGAAIEFKSPGTFTPVTGYRDGGPHGLNAAERGSPEFLRIGWTGSHAGI